MGWLGARGRLGGFGRGAVLAGGLSETAWGDRRGSSEAGELISNALLEYDPATALFAQPWAGASWEAWVIDQIIVARTLQAVSFQVPYFRTSDGLECDLVVDMAGFPEGIEIKLTSSPTLADFGKLEADARGVGERVVRASGIGDGDLGRRRPIPVRQGELRFSHGFPEELLKGDEVAEVPGEKKPAAVDLVLVGVGAAKGGVKLGIGIPAARVEGVGGGGLHARMRRVGYGVEQRRGGRGSGESAPRFRYGRKGTRTKALRASATSERNLNAPASHWKRRGTRCADVVLDTAAGFQTGFSSGPMAGAEEKE